VKKRTLSLILTTIFAFSIMAGCSPKVPQVELPISQTEDNQNEDKRTDEVDEKEPMRIGLLNGPTAIGAVMLMNEMDNGTVFGNYEFQIYTTPDEVMAKIISGELDVAAVPVNMAGVLYNKTKGQVLIGAVNTLGTLYLVENGTSINSMEDVSGKNIVMAGQGAVPEYVLQYILDKAEVTDCTIEFVQSHAEAVAALAGGKAELALLPEPFVSVATAKNSSLRVAVDIAEEWDVYSYEEEDVPNTLPMGCIVVRNEYLNKNQKEFNKFLDEYGYFVEVAIDDPAVSADYVVKYGILENKEIAEKAIPNCNIAYVEGSKMLRLVENFFTIMYEADPRSIGGAVPDKNIYYVRKY